MCIKEAESNFFLTQQTGNIGYYTKDKKDSNKLDIVIVEATAINEDGWIARID
jgi:acetyl-CoA hydrolase